MTYVVFHILFALLFVYLSINTAYLLVMAVAGRLISLKDHPPSIIKKNFAVLITSYKEDEVIVRSAASAFQHNYPKEHFEVFLAADHLSAETMRLLQATGVNVQAVYFEKGSKARSLNHLLNSIPDNKYDVALVLDGDNIMMPGTMEKINAAFSRGYQAVQAHRTAKNTDTSIAVLDAISEEVNNHLFRRSQRALGFSSTTSGSGMAFTFRKLKEVYNKPGILDNPACDREVDFEMMKAGITVEYLDNAFVLDEKVSKKHVFRNQRRRWLESQLVHLKLFFSGKENVRLRNKDYWNKLFINLIPPRVVFLMIYITLFCIIAAELYSGVRITGISLTAWICLFVAYLVSILIAIPARFYSTKTARALLKLPAILLSYISAIVSMKVSRKEFVHTPKSYTGSDSSSPDEY